MYQEGKSLEEFFEKLLLKWAPAYAYDECMDDCIAQIDGEDDETLQPSRKYRRIITD